MEEFEIKNIRGHFGGQWKIVGGVKMYEDGTYVDILGVDGDTLNYMDLVDEFKSKLGIPPNGVLHIEWLGGCIRRTVDNDARVMNMWKHNLMDKEGYMHIYLKFQDKPSSSTYTSSILDHSKENTPPENIQNLDKSPHKPDLQDHPNPLRPPLVEKLPIKRKENGFGTSVGMKKNTYYEEAEELIEEELDLNPTGFTFGKKGNGNEGIGGDKFASFGAYVSDGDSSGGEEDDLLGEEVDLDEYKTSEKFEKYIEEVQSMDPDFDINEYMKGGDMEKTLYVGKEWSNIGQVRLALQEYSISNKFLLKYVRNEGYRIRTKCKEDNCTWECNVRRLPDGRNWKLRKLVNEHTCESTCVTRNPMANAKWIAHTIEQDMRLHHKTFTPKVIVKEMWRRFTISIKYWLAWHARSIALEKIHGNFEESYKFVPEMCKEILKSNPGSLVCYRVNESTREFQSLCIALKASLDGFIEGCRPIVGLDGCHLKGKYGGVLLSVISLDGNNGMFPLAIYFCDTENQENWNHFLELIAPEILRHPLKLTIISDREKGLIDAVAKVFIGCNQRYCFRHFYHNMKSKHRGKDICFKSWDAAKAYKKTIFEKCMSDLSRINPKAREWLMQEDPKLWARSYLDRESKCEHLTNNFTECFNSWILELRDKPICVMVEQWLLMMMTLVNARKKKGRHEMKGDLVPRARDRINDLKLEMGKFEVEGCDEDDLTYTVKEGAREWCEVSLTLKTCTCEVWQLSGIPCAHVVSIIHPQRLSLTEYCSPFVTIDLYKKTYNGKVRPFIPQSEWPEPTVVVAPPAYKRPRGRPKKNRRKSFDEGGRDGQPKKKKNCTRCGKSAHNRRTCKNAPRASQVTCSQISQSTPRKKSLETSHAEVVHNAPTTMPLPNTQPLHFTYMHFPMFSPSSSLFQGITHPTASTWTELMQAMSGVIPTTQQLDPSQASQRSQKHARF